MVQPGRKKEWNMNHRREANRAESQPTPERLSERLGEESMDFWNRLKPSIRKKQKRSLESREPWEGQKAVVWPFPFSDKVQRDASRLDGSGHVDLTSISRLKRFVSHLLGGGIPRKARARSKSKGSGLFPEMFCGEACGWTRGRIPN